jgi:hypothetical protein
MQEMAFVRGCSDADIQLEVNAAGGDLEIDSKLGQVVAVRVAIRLGREGLIRPEDQKRRNLTTVGSLRRLILRRLAA